MGWVSLGLVLMDHPLAGSCFLESKTKAPGFLGLKTVPLEPAAVGGSGNNGCLGSRHLVYEACPALFCAVTQGILAVIV